MKRRKGSRERGGDGVIWSQRVKLDLVPKLSRDKGASLWVCAPVHVA